MEPLVSPFVHSPHGMTSVCRRGLTATHTPAAAATCVMPCFSPSDSQGRGPSAPTRDDGASRTSTFQVFDRPGRRRARGERGPTLFRRPFQWQSGQEQEGDCEAPDDGSSSVVMQAAVRQRVRG